MGKLLWEAIERSTTGPLMSEEKFETELLPSVLADVQSKYKVEWDPSEPAMIDPDMADAVFKAGMEYLLEAFLSRVPYAATRSGTRRAPAWQPDRSTALPSIRGRS